MVNTLKAEGPEETASTLLAGNESQNHKAIIDQYCLFFDTAQNKEVLCMAIEKSAEALVKFEKPSQHNLSLAAADYFGLKFKRNFLGLEKSIISSWRTHKAFYEAIGQVVLTTTDKKQ